MNKIRLLGLVSFAIGLLGLLYFDEFGFLSGILTGVGIGWLLTGKFINTKNSRELSSSTNA